MNDATDEAMREGFRELAKQGDPIVTDLATQLREGPTPECDETWKDGDDYLLLLTARSLERRLAVAVGALERAPCWCLHRDNSDHPEHRICSVHAALQLLRGTPL